MALDNFSSSDNIHEIYLKLQKVAPSLVSSPTFDIHTTGVKSVAIPHGLSAAPPLGNCHLTIQENTSVDDWAHGFLKVYSVDATNVNCKVNVTTGSATAGATAKLSLRASLN